MGSRFAQEGRNFAENKIQIMIVNNYFWNLYKQSSQGKTAIRHFEDLASQYCSIDFIVQTIQRYDPEIFLNSTEDEVRDSIQDFNSYFRISSFEHEIRNSEEIREMATQFLKQFDENHLLTYFIPLSIYLYQLRPDYFIPYLFFARFQYFLQVIDDLDLDLYDKIPGEGNKQKRISFYLDICDALYKYKTENGLTSNEMCAAIYDMERHSYDSETNADTTAYPRVWWIVGRKSEKESVSKTLFFQGNKEMRKGDIAVFFERSDTYVAKGTPKEINPKSAITGIWTIQSDGNIDPFFYYYRYCIISDEVKIKPIKFKTIKESPITCNIHGVSAQMQNYSGREIPKDDYLRILQLIKECDSNFDENTLPRPYESKTKTKDGFIPFDERGDMKPEKWVEEALIIPLLREMGWDRLKVDYRQQEYLQLGRKKEISKQVQAGRPDFSVFPFGDNHKCADIVIEAKGPGEMDGKKLQEAFDQGESYASRQYAELLILADDKRLLLYTRSKQGNFKFSTHPYEEYTWEALHNDEESMTQLYNTFLKFQKHKPKK